MKATFWWNFNVHRKYNDPKPSFTGFSLDQRRKKPAIFAQLLNRKLTLSVSHLSRANFFILETSSFG